MEEVSKDYATVAGIGGYHRINGRMLHLSPILPATKAAAIEYLKGLLLEDPVAAVKQELEGLPQDLQARLVRDAILLKKEAAEAQLEEWSTSLDGIAFYLWQQLKPQRPETTKEWCELVLKQMTEEEAKALVEKMGEVSGFPNVKGPAEKKPRKRRSSSRASTGSSSSGPSRSGTTGNRGTSSD